MADVDLESPLNHRHEDSYSYKSDMYYVSKMKKVDVEKRSAYKYSHSENNYFSDTPTPPQKSRMTMDEFLDGLSFLSAIFLVGMISWAHTQSCYYAYC